MRHRIAAPAPVRGAGRTADRDPGRELVGVQTFMGDLSPLWLSLRVASLATLLIVAVGLPAALLLARVRFPGKPLVAGALILPLVLPPTVLGYFLLTVLGRQSIVGHWLEA